MTLIRRRSRMYFAVVASFCLALFQLCSAQVLNCSVTRNETQTTYRVLDSSRPPEYQESRCSFSWSNENGTKLADNSAKMSSVKESSINTLVNSDCIENVVCKQHCISQTNNKLYDFTANCTTSCVKNGSSHNDSLAQDEDKDGKQIFKIIAGLAGLVALGALGALGLLVFVLWKCRDRIRSTFNYSRCGVRYHSGTPQNAELNPPVVLVEN